METKHTRNLLDSIKKLYDDGKYSDLIVTSSEKSYRVHKAIVCPRSMFFAKACDGHFEEASTGVVNLTEEDPHTVEVMMYYLYHSDYPPILPSFRVADLCPQSLPASIIIPDPPDIPPEAPIDGAPTDEAPSESIAYDWGTQPMGKKKKRKEKTLWDFEAEAEEPPTAQNPKPPALSLALHTRVFALAEMHGVAGLKDLALLKFRHEAKTHWEADDFLLAAEIAYVETVEEVRELRQAVIEVFQQHCTLLRTENCRDLLKRLPDLSYDLLLRVHGMDNSCSWRERKARKMSGEIIF